MSKLATKPKTFTAIDMYIYYATKLLKNNEGYTSKRQHGIKHGVIYNKDNEEIITYKLFKTILSKYNQEAGQALIGGYSLNLLNGLGKIYIARIERNPNELRLNRGESFKLRRRLKESNTPLTHDNWKVYYTDEEYITILWHKQSSTRNIIMYEFQPAGGQVGKGFRQIMSKTISANSSLKALYPYIPRV